MSYAAVAQDETEDRYHTQIEAGDVRLFTLDQLDAAFNAGLIHENTYVCLEGDSQWLTLGEVAGLGDEEPVSAPHLVAASVPQARSITAASPYGAYAASPSVIPAAPYSVSPMVMPRSIAPVSLSFDDDFEMMAMRPKRRLGKVVAGLAVLALAAAGFAVVQSGGVKLPKLPFGKGAGQGSAASLTLSNLNDSQATRAQPAPAPEPAKPEPPKAEAAKPAETTLAATETTKVADKTDSDQGAKKSDDRFSEDMKAALLNKDKKQSATQKQKKAARTAVAAKQKGGKAGKSAAGSTGFKSGGSAYDPLNGKL
jgi:pyruvate/2-oxoglutarate dehydrogenase complex dihydrolipoamide acyltransferase (E2) component